MDTKQVVVGVDGSEQSLDALAYACAEATVKFHVRNLRDKLEVRRRTEIVHTATRQGIV